MVIMKGCNTVQRNPVYSHRDSPLKQVSFPEPLDQQASIYPSQGNKSRLNQVSFPELLDQQASIYPTQGNKSRLKQVSFPEPLDQQASI